ncbi:ribose 5-phosphate isomerase A [Paenibacillus polymyxa]|uniref:ribose 5-phosphate isomerase A n=1 Tax=Paenibacillus polymyxa TaxID=1406 RepID=UPI003D287723
MITLSTDTIKNKCAKEALTYIRDDTVIGLGGGSTISYLIRQIKESGRRVKVITPSGATAALCIQHGLPLLPLWSVEQVSVAFDGCDEVDEQLRALKSGGGIHTREKLVATMAEHYILLVDESKVVKELTFSHPVVLEILEDALSYVQKSVTSLGGNGMVRSSPTKDGYTISDYGHLLMDVFFRERIDIEKIQSSLKKISGVIETSLFTEEVTGVLVGSEHGVRFMSKKIDTPK